MKKNSDKSSDYFFLLYKLIKIDYSVMKIFFESKFFTLALNQAAEVNLPPLPHTMFLDEILSSVYQNKNPQNNSKKDWSPY
jgi:hypothetical protein